MSEKVNRISLVGNVLNTSGNKEANLQITEDHTVRMREGHALPVHVVSMGCNDDGKVQVIAEKIDEKRKELTVLEDAIPVVEKVVVEKRGELYLVSYVGRFESKRFGTFIVDVVIHYTPDKEEAKNVGLKLAKILNIGKIVIFDRVQTEKGVRSTVEEIQVA